MASSEEEDYMSDAFLLKCQDVKPGLASAKSRQKNEKTKCEAQANRKNHVLAKHQLEAVHREEGLQTSISSHSKGFLLLQKMGYKPGTGIGRKGDGRLDPVTIELKSGRSGLGKESEMKRKASEMNAMRASMKAKRQRAVEDQKKSFLGRMKDRYSLKTTERDLRVAQAACFQMDKEQSIVEPDRLFFWPPKNLPTSKEAEDEDEEEEEESEEEEEMKGSTRTMYPGLPQDSDDDLDCGEEALAPTDEFSLVEQLDILTRYLRNSYFYCIWCGTRYRDLADLSSTCPGSTADDHD